MFWKFLTIAWYHASVCSARTRGGVWCGASEVPPLRVLLQMAEWAVESVPLQAVVLTLSGAPELRYFVRYSGFP